MSEPTPQPSIDVWEIARRHAVEALATIANRQMNTWTKFPSNETPRDIITTSIVRALREAGIERSDAE